MRGKVFHILENVPGAVGDLLLPRECIVCGRKLLRHERHLCTWCLSDLPKTWFWLQERNAMADKFNLIVQKRYVEKAHGTPFVPYVSAAALFFYRTGTGYRKITQSLKYHADILAGRYFARMLAEVLKGSAAIPVMADAVVPVPLHWTRRWSRGYNQAEVIAAALVEGGIGGTMAPDLLVRNRRTRTQTKLDVGEKSANVSGAFSVNARAAARLAKARQGQDSGTLGIILVDDVFTTGATLYECWKALREWDGSVRISVVTLGYVG